MLSSQKCNVTNHGFAHLHVFYSDELIPLFEFDYIFQIHTL